MTELGTELSNELATVATQPLAAGLFDGQLFEQGWQSLSLFMQQGGPILWGLALVGAASWLVVIERLIYVFSVFPKQEKHWIEQWRQRKGQREWASRAIRDGWLFEAHVSLHRNLNLLKALVSLCPMLGLLGTVTGMITVFDVMAVQGTGEPRLMAAGISMATLPTMAGMVVALAGMFAQARISKICERREASLTKALRSRS